METKDLPRLAKWLGPNSFIAFVALVLLGGAAYSQNQLAKSIGQEVIDREDQILSEERIIRERLVVLEQEIKSANIAAQQRFDDWMRMQEELNETWGDGLTTVGDWLRASCYAAANGDSAAQAHCNNVKSP